MLNANVRVQTSLLAASMDGRTDGPHPGLLAAWNIEGAGISLLCCSRWSDIMTEELESKTD